MVTESKVVAAEPGAINALSAATGEGGGATAATGEGCSRLRFSASVCQRFNRALNACSLENARIVLRGTISSARSEPLQMSNTQASTRLGDLIRIISPPDDMDKHRPH
ncbi:MAG: hypothetical protein LH470_09245 [Lysobacter sp.]|nr:hypothetical protein [Lysobacter sp.]